MPTSKAVKILLDNGWRIDVVSRQLNSIRTINHVELSPHFTGKGNSARLFCYSSYYCESGCYTIVRIRKHVLPVNFLVSSDDGGGRFSLDLAFLSGDVSSLFRCCRSSALSPCCCFSADAALAVLITST